MQRRRRRAPVLPATCATTARKEWIKCRAAPPLCRPATSPSPSRRWPPHPRESKGKTCGLKAPHGTGAERISARPPSRGIPSSPARASENEPILASERGEGAADSELWRMCGRVGRPVSCRGVAWVAYGATATGRHSRRRMRRGASNWRRGRRSSGGG